MTVEANNSTIGTELYRANAGGGMFLIKDINPGAPNAFGGCQSDRAEANGALFFIANDGTNGQELWYYKP